MPKALRSQEHMRLLAREVTDDMTIVAGYENTCCLGGQPGRVLSQNRDAAVRQARVNPGEGARRAGLLKRLTLFMSWKPGPSFDRGGALASDCSVRKGTRVTSTRLLLCGADRRRLASSVAGLM